MKKSTRFFVIFEANRENMDSNPTSPTDGWETHGKALRAYHEGRTMALLRMRYKDGDHADLPVGIFFRLFAECPELEQYALELCKGKVLDVGAGTGVHALVLQRRAFDVTGLDIAEGAVAVMRDMGLKQAVCADIFDYQGGPFDTMLALMNGIGFVEDLHGLERFFAHAKTLLHPDGQMLIDSSDIREVPDLQVLFGEKYFGETSLELEFEGSHSGALRWLYIDPDQLAETAAACGWHSQVVFTSGQGRFLARLTQA